MTSIDWTLDKFGLVFSPSPKLWHPILIPSLIYKELSNESALKIIMMQQHRIKINKPETLNLVFHQCSLDDFSIHPKLFSYLKYHSHSLNIHIIETDDIPSKPIWTYSQNLYKTLHQATAPPETGENTDIPNPKPNPINILDNI